MACKNVCRLCDKLIISTAVNTDGTNLYIGVPAGTYFNGEKYCIVIAQAIPATTPISAPVIIRIGTSTTNYYLRRCDCSTATACNVRTRTKYSTKLVTDGTSAAFRLLGKICCCNRTDSASVTG